VPCNEKLLWKRNVCLEGLLKCDQLFMKLNSWHSSRYRSAKFPRWWSAL